MKNRYKTDLARARGCFWTPSGPLRYVNRRSNRDVEVAREFTYRTRPIVSIVKIHIEIDVLLLNGLHGGRPAIIYNRKRPFLYQNPVFDFAREFTYQTQHGVPIVKIRIKVYIDHFNCKNTYQRPLCRCLAGWPGCLAWLAGLLAGLAGLPGCLGWLAWLAGLAGWPGCVPQIRRFP